MAKTVYTYELRRIDCAKCGAPVVCPVEGGPTSCTFCHSPLSVGRRRKDPPVYGVELPQPELLPARTATLVERAREHPAGRFALATFARHRRETVDRE